MTDLEIVQSCPLGMTVDDVMESLYRQFMHWMRGQTMALCEGTEYDHEQGRSVDSGCAETPHGLVVYPSDFRRYCEGRPIVD